MLTRLKVSGFKNLVDVDVRFGPFTCIAGANGVGKSNLFDAIGFLGALANSSLIEAAMSVREGRTADVRSLFHRVGDGYDNTMSFEAEMIVPEKGTDDLGQEAKASITFLRYSVELSLRKPESRSSLGELEIVKEELERINTTDSHRHLMFPHKMVWRKSTIKGQRTASFISTEKEESSTTRIRLHQDRGESGGRTTLYLASTLPRTVLSSVNNATENRTAVLVRREMQSWRRLQLEPSALREPDMLSTPRRLGSNGSHLAATLYRLAHAETDPSIDLPNIIDTIQEVGVNVETHLTPGENASNNESKRGRSDVYAKVANRLLELIDDVREVRVDVDPQRELLTIFAKGKDRTSHSARALSDGTLRFLALAVIELDPEAQGVLCLEEPENGIHPARIPAMLDLLRAIAMDVDYPIGPDNPLRQVIINTHSPIVVGEVTDDTLIVARSKETVRKKDNQRFQRVSFGCLSGTWRAAIVGSGESPDIVARGDLLKYLNPIFPLRSRPNVNGHPKVSKKQPKPQRVVDRLDLQELLYFGDDPE